ncbi:MAG: sulfotransferase [Candidatus Omnitrophota bacterium]|nr:MAG: sulfotransferase [Candidatus Omnitrophota bacterium]
MLQQILSNHPAIHTLPEPWIALPTLYALYTRKIDRNYNTEYSRYWARTAIKDFVQRLPKGEKDYLEGIRRMYTHLYNCAMEGSGKKYFLDKGPRYYHIIPELYKVFPEALYIILLRNPLAVLNSIINFINKKYDQIHQFKHDLLKGPRLLPEGIKLLGQQCTVAHYEQLLKSPDAEIRKICEKLHIEFFSNMLSYDFKEEYKNSYGYQEQKDDYKSGGPDVQNIDKWAMFLKDPQTWRLASDYLHYLGKDIIDCMGYSHTEMQQLLERYNPGRIKLGKTTSLLRLIKRSEIDFLMLKPKNPRSLRRFLERWLAYLLK